MMFQCTNCEGSGYFDTPSGGEVACSVCHGSPEIDASALNNAITERNAATAELHEMHMHVDVLESELVRRAETMDTLSAERDELRAAITEMAARYKQHKGRYGGTGIADELELILNTTRANSNKPDDPATCERCGSTYQVTFEPDPYQEDINDDHTPVWECARCRTESAADI